jgi:hypothetical protein
MDLQTRSARGHRERSEGGFLGGVERGNGLHDYCASGIGHETLPGLQNHIRGSASLGQPQPSLAAVNSHTADAARNAPE